jgi:hypothetical protein
MINLLMRDPSIVLQDIVVLRSSRLDEFLHYWLVSKSAHASLLSFLPLSIPPSAKSNDFMVLCVWEKDEPESQSVGHQGYRPVSRRGIWGLQAMRTDVLASSRLGIGLQIGRVVRRTAWPLERGLMSRNARTLSDSKSLKEGMSPVTTDQLMHSFPYL